LLVNRVNRVIGIIGAPDKGQGEPGSVQGVQHVIELEPSG